MSQEVVLEQGDFSFEKIQTVPIVMNISFVKFLLSCVLVIFEPFSTHIANAQVNPDYWPTEGWNTSTLEGQGIDSGLIITMLEKIITDGIDIDTISIVRNGYLVADIYMFPSKKDKKHRLYSCTKSFTSTLIGIAVDKGYIDNVDQRIVDFYPGRTIQNMNDLKRSITLENLLTMSSGLKTEDNPKKHGLYGVDQMMATRDWTQYILDRPMAAPPGTRFEYGNLGSFLLTSILSEQTKVSAKEFAHKHLFGPLGIKDVTWHKSPKGIYRGYSDMFMTPLDMAKLGFLYLNNGLWNNQQILSKSWVKKATKGHLPVSASLKYGYQWWVEENYFFALGYEGQFIFIIPEKNMVVVFTSSLMGQSLWTPQTFLNEYILPAAKSAKALPENQKNFLRMEELTNDLLNKYYHEIKVSE